MKRLYLTLFAVIFAVTAIVACKRVAPEGSTPTGSRPTVPTGPAPKIVFAELAHDFGVVESGATLEHVFLFKNEGEGELLLQQPRGS